MQEKCERKGKFTSIHMFQSPIMCLEVPYVPINSLTILCSGYRYLCFIVRKMKLKANDFFQSSFFFFFNLRRGLPMLFKLASKLEIVLPQTPDAGIIGMYHIPSE